MKSIKPHLHAKGKMKLKEPRRAPVGGWWYRYTIHRNNLEFPATVYGESLTRLIENVLKDMRSNGVTAPADIAEAIEIQICERQPPDRCWIGAGDRVAQAIHGAARIVDKIAGTRLEQKAKGCSSCRQRRQALNQMFNK
jgi:hypothetical protein